METLKNDEELRAHLMMTHPEFRMCFEQHHEFELRLNDLEAKAHLSDDEQMEEVRLRQMLERIQHSRIVITYPKRLTPFCFPIKVDSLRENLTSEKLEDRVRRMQQQLENYTPGP